MSFRTFLYAPAHRMKFVRSALSTQPPCDAVILDLEDGVPSDERENAFINLAELAAESVPARPVFIRIRSLTDEQEEDLQAVPSWTAGIVVTKVGGPEDLVRAASHARALSANCQVWPLIESALGIEALPEILRETRELIGGVMLGAGDLRADLEVSATPNETELLYARSRLVYVCRSQGISHIIDTPDPELRPSEQFIERTKAAKSLGMTGKAAIHPAQIEVIRSVFSPTADQISWARAVLAAEDGATRVDGELVDEATKRRARGILSEAHE